MPILLSSAAAVSDWNEVVSVMMLGLVLGGLSALPVLMSWSAARSVRRWWRRRAG